ncbi:MAG TPA: dTMP kinase [Armatimonadota bacterium]|jgi:dTMP kinase
MNSAPGKFIVLDGVEGSGKSTQANLLVSALLDRGLTPLYTREPGGTPVGLRLRHLLLNEEVEISPTTEAFLFCADRADHLDRVIVPSLREGRWVICDRFSSSTYAYQVCAGRMDADLFRSLDALARSVLRQVPGREDSAGQPDLTVILDLDPENGLSRYRQQPALFVEDKIEARPVAYHRQVRAGFLAYAQQLGPAAVVLDAGRPVEEVHQDLLRVLGLSD